MENLTVRLFFTDEMFANKEYVKHAIRDMKHQLFDELFNTEAIKHSRTYTIRLEESWQRVYRIPSSYYAPGREVALKATVSEALRMPTPTDGWKIARDWRAHVQKERSRSERLQRWLRGCFIKEIAKDDFNTWIGISD